MTIPIKTNYLLKFTKSGPILIKTKLGYENRQYVFVTGDTAQTPVLRMDNRIVGGMYTEISKYPYQLSLEYLGKHFCGAALISPDWVITAAHCVDRLFINFISVRAGATREGEGGKVVRIKEKLTHSRFDRSAIDYDIALLKLNEPISEVYAKPIKLPREGLILKEGVIGEVTGWGATSETGSVSKQLRVTEVPVLSQSSCRKIYGTNAITTRMFCAGYSEGGKDACQGDSGGPFVVNDTLYGIVSWGYGCARPGHPGVYANVSVLRNFIKQVCGV